MWLGWSLCSVQLNLDLPARLVFASAEGEGCKLLREFSGHKAPTRKVRFELFAPEFWKFCVEFGRDRISERPAVAAEFLTGEPAPAVCDSGKQPNNSSGLSM